MTKQHCHYTISNVRPRKAAEPATSPFVVFPLCFLWSLRVLGPFFIYILLLYTIFTVYSVSILSFFLAMKAASKSTSFLGFVSSSLSSWPPGNWGSSRGSTGRSDSSYTCILWAVIW